MVAKYDFRKSSLYDGSKAYTPICAFKQSSLTVVCDYMQSDCSLRQSSGISLNIIEKLAMHSSRVMDRTLVEEGEISV
jgi:hypothetical protein